MLFSCRHHAMCRDESSFSPLSSERDSCPWFPPRAAECPGHPAGQSNRPRAAAVSCDLRRSSRPVQRGPRRDTHDGALHGWLFVKPHRQVSQRLITIFRYGVGSHDDRAGGHPSRRISHVGTIPSVTTRDRDSRHRAVRDAVTAQVAVTADQDSVRAAKVTPLLIKRCRTVLTERCR